MPLGYLVSAVKSGEIIVKFKSSRSYCCVAKRFQEKNEMVFY